MIRLCAAKQIISNRFGAGSHFHAYGWLLPFISSVFRVQSVAI
jgi:hypothetical protein